MRKLIICLLVISICVICGYWFWNYMNNSKGNNENIKNKADNTEMANQQNDQNQSNIQSQKNIEKQETEISNASTKIYNKDEKRQKNIEITCNKLNNVEILPGETFSFCSTVGKASEKEGYQLADIYVNGKKEQGLGGGNCQVSTTLYNAVLNSQEFEVVERHEHSGHVPYIEKGKDAAVSYGIYDFKFKNNSEYTIKIVMEKTTDNITAKLYKIQPI